MTSCPHCRVLEDRLDRMERELDEANFWRKRNNDRANEQESRAEKLAHLLRHVSTFPPGLDETGAAD